MSNQAKLHINYFDFGLYNAIELRWMKAILPLFTNNYSLYGFEACKSHFKKIRPLEDTHTKLFNVAISNSTEKIVKLYHAENRVGHSIYSSKNNVSTGFERVKPIRFSEWIINQNISLKNAFNIVKINIEGAEWDFFTDIVENNIHAKIDLFYMSFENDVNKVGEFKKNGVIKEYERLLRENGIRPIFY